MFRMELLGAEVRPVTSGSRTLKDAVNEAMREWVASVDTTHYCLGSVMGPHPFPYMVRQFQRVVGEEAAEQCRALLDGAAPDVVVACVGGGSNAAGTFAGFVDTRGPAGRRRGRGRSRHHQRHPRRAARHVLPAAPRRGRARSTKPSPSLRVWTIPDLGPSTPIWPRSGEPSTPRPATKRYSRPSACSATPRGSSLRSSRPTRWPGWPVRPAPMHCPAGSTVMITLSGRGTRTWPRCVNLRSPGPWLTSRRSLRARRDEGRKLLIPYLMGGMSDDWEQTLAAVVAAGADAVEVGIPFSDPMMDGPVIQEAALCALGRGVVPDEVIDGIARAEAPVPIAVMTYYNIVFRAGHKRMARSLAAPASAAPSCPTCPLRRSHRGRSRPTRRAIDTVLLVAPSSPPERVERICARARGFVYAVARMGVTGERGDLGSRRGEGGRAHPALYRHAGVRRRGRVDAGAGGRGVPGGRRRGGGICPGAPPARGRVAPTVRPPSSASLRQPSTNGESGVRARWRGRAPAGRPRWDAPHARRTP